MGTVVNDWYQRKPIAAPLYPQGSVVRLRSHPVWFSRGVTVRDVFVGFIKGDVHWVYYFEEHSVGCEEELLEALK